MKTPRKDSIVHSISDTPRTDAAISNARYHFVYDDISDWAIDLAKGLERELAAATEYADETHARHQSLVEQIAKLKDENAALSEELKEQAVVNGIGGEREAKLLAELDKLRNENARLNGQTRWQCTCGGTDCDGQRENAALREALEAIANASGFDNIGNWARNKARAALDAARKKAQP